MILTATKECQHVSQNNPKACFEKHLPTQQISLTCSKDPRLLQQLLAKILPPHQKTQDWPTYQNEAHGIQYQCTNATHFVVTSQSP